MRFESLCCVDRDRPTIPGVFRMAIDRSFTVAGHGTVVTGTVASGSVAVGDELEWQPAGRIGARARLAPARPAGRADRPGLARRDQPGGRSPRRDSPRPGAGRARISAGDADSFGRGGRLGTRPFARSGTAGATSFTWVRPRSRPSCRCWRRTKRALASPSSPSSSSPSRWSRFTVSPSCSARRARRRPWEAAACCSPRRDAIAGATRRRSPASAACARPTRLDRLRAALAFLGLDALDRASSLGAWPAWPRTRSNPAWRRWRPRGPSSIFRSGRRRTVRVLGEFAAELEDRVLRALGRLHAAHPRHSAIPRAQLAAASPTWPTTALVAGLIDRLEGARQGGRRCAHRGASRLSSPSSARANGSSRPSWPRRSARAAMSPPTRPSWPPPRARAGGRPRPARPAPRRSSKSSRSARRLYLDVDVESRAAPTGQGTARRRLGHHDGRAPRPAGHDPEVRRPHRRIPRPHRLDPARRRRAAAGACPGRCARFAGLIGRRIERGPV